jgi:CRP/FNR family transcriptional regulator, cyclic AMP receptor protein
MPHSLSARVSICPPARAARQTPAFDLKSFFDSARLRKKSAKFRAKEPIFVQGDPANSVMYIQEGGVKLSIVNEVGREAVVAVLGPGDFLGEGCLAGQITYVASATVIAPATVLVIQKDEMLRALHGQHEFSDHFIAYMLQRNIRAEEDLVNQLFNSCEKRLARALLLLAHYGSHGAPDKVISNVSQEMLAEMIGATRPRVNVFMNKFRKLGFIEYKNDIRVHNSLLSVVLHE